MTSSELYVCENLRHAEAIVPARHSICVVGGSFGYTVCDDCLLDYVTNTYLRSEYLQHQPFEVRPI